MFSYGCAVFLQSDIVNFQRQGWQSQEIVAAAAKAFTEGKSGAIGLALLLTLVALAVVWIRYPHKDEEVAYFESVQSPSTTP